MKNRMVHNNFKDNVLAKKDIDKSAYASSFMNENNIDIVDVDSKKAMEDDVRNEIKPHYQHKSFYDVVSELRDSESSTQVYVGVDEFGQEAHYIRAPYDFEFSTSAAACSGYYLDRKGSYRGIVSESQSSGDEVQYDTAHMEHIETAYGKDSDAFIKYGQIPVNVSVRTGDLIRIDNCYRPAVIPHESEENSAVAKSLEPSDKPLSEMKILQYKTDGTYSRDGKIIRVPSYSSVDIDIVAYADDMVNNPPEDSKMIRSAPLERPLTESVALSTQNTFTGFVAFSNKVKQIRTETSKIIPPSDAKGMVIDARAFDKADEKRQFVEIVDGLQLEKEKVLHHGDIHNNKSSRFDFNKNLYGYGNNKSNGYEPEM